MLQQRWRAQDDRDNSSARGELGHGTPILRRNALQRRLQRNLTLK